ncbi:TFIIA-alpha and beta-like factor [Puntigrus tetrazona]|uniref:TFIIA-alpha and beta-like factor n=1 Tax=Puntigrus tetrazona TaxID=1606681 RepID=UPI001C88ED41|nr:TFIIA-alpha and beta-like factor [Puntigrus tetrazona]
MMLSNANSLPKLYLSVIEDVIESIRELFSDEGVEERVLDNLRQLWESKVIQSKAVEGFIKDNNPSSFVLQLPTNYSQSLHKPTVVIPAAQNVPSFSSKASSCASVATFSLPAGITYPVQIPAGVTLQTASGHLYKVNVPVMVTRGAQHVLKPLSQPGAMALSSALTQRSDPAPAVRESLPSPDEFTLDGIEFSPQLSAQQTQSSDDGPPEPQADVKLETDLNFNQLLDITQLDGVADSSSGTEEDDDDNDDDDLGLVGENEFLGMINATEEEELEEEEDPLNSGDDVSEQDIPEIFDTENVIVCQYDKIHRSKNRWKFYLKDGVMCYGGKDYVFSKAVGEAEW